jgi:hypothetical protein
MTCCFSCQSGSLSLASGVELTCGEASLQSSAISMASSASELAVQGACSASGSNSISGGTFNCDYDNYGCYVNAASGSSISHTNVALSPATYQLADQSTATFSGCAVNQASSIYGTASSSVSYQSGTTVVNAPLYHESPCSVPSGGEIQATNNGAVTVADTYAMTLSGGTLGCSGSCASGSSANYIIGSTSGSGGSLTCASNTASYQSGGVVQLASSGSTYNIQQGASHTVVCHLCRFPFNSDCNTAPDRPCRVHWCWQRLHRGHARRRFHDYV